MAAKTHTGITLEIQETNGTYRTASADEIIYAARSAINRRFRRGRALSSPADSRDFLKLRLAHLEHEVFAVLWLGLPSPRYRIRGTVSRHHRRQQRPPP